MHIMALARMKCFCFIFTAFCFLIIWFTVSCTTTYYYYSRTYENIEHLQYSIQLESKFVNKLMLRNDTLSNLDNFEFVMNNDSLCMKTATTETDSDVVIMIHTARYNFDHRYAIRSTWGSIKMYKQWRFHLIFLLGIDPDSDPASVEENRLWDESKDNGDLIMGNFVDSYQNLTYKHLMGYKWVSTFCPAAKYILKTDDDIYADIFQVMDVLLAELINSGKTYACENMGGNRPNRDNTSKWYAPKELFAEDMYPDFCSGSAYIVKADAAAKISSISEKTKFFWIDDAYVTGILRETYNKIADNESNRNLEILTLYNRHHLGNKNEIINWCTQDLSTSQLNYAFILLNNEEFIRNTFCIWNKVRLMTFAMNLALGHKIDQ